VDLFNWCSETRLGPERFHFTTELDAETDNLYEQYYILRPEVVETYFYLWRVTKQPKYRNWAWDATMVFSLLLTTLFCRIFS